MRVFVQQRLRVMLTVNAQQYAAGGFERGKRNGPAVDLAHVSAVS